MVLFLCHANKSDSIQFLVDNKSAALTSVRDRLFLESAIEERLNASSLNRNLTVRASSSRNNNSVIKCIGVGPSTNTESQEAVLRVQGEFVK